MLALPAVPEFLRPWLDRTPPSVLLLELGLPALLGLAATLWGFYGRGPRRRRLYRRVQRLLQQKAWREALASAQDLQRLATPRWHSRVDALAAACYRLAGDHTLAEKAYEEALQHYRSAARLSQENEAVSRQGVLEEMLAEVRRLFGADSVGSGDTVQPLIVRVLQVEPASAEALFWQGLCHVRQGQTDAAVAALQQAREACGLHVLDPSLYLGALLLQEGKVPDALRYLSEANRIDANCPFVAWQLGTAIVAHNGDGLAVRALQRALAANGLPRWARAPQKAWVEGLPPWPRSFIQRLAATERYRCPVLGSDVTAMICQAQVALAQAQQRLGNDQEAANLYSAVLQESPPTLPVLRGLGLSLARLKHYDQAFKHLRIAHEQEMPRSPRTAGYLALCGALGKPLRTEDKARNILWAIQLLGQFDTQGDTEWAEIYSAVFAEARSAGVVPALPDQRRLCDVLASVAATDQAAATAYAQLAAASPEALRPQHAWLYCRAAQQHHVCEEGELDLFARAFQDEAASRAFYAQQHWNFDEIEYTYLERQAACMPGRFPEALGPDYPARATNLLLARSEREEQAGRLEAAQASADVLLKLAPRNPRAHDRLACLLYRRGDLDGAATLLAQWHALDVADHWPLVRRAVIEGQRGQGPACQQAIEQALQRTQGRTRAAIAFLGGRLALVCIDSAQRTSDAQGESEARHDGENADMRPAMPVAAAGSFSESACRRAQLLFQQCLQDEPDHGQARWCLAAVFSLLQDRAALAAQSRAMNRPEISDARFHFVAAASHLAAQEYPEVIEAGQRAARDASLVAEIAYLTGWARLKMGASAAAAVDLQRVVEQAPHGPSVNHARALLGNIHFGARSFGEAINQWRFLEAGSRSAWQVEEPLRKTLLLSGLLDLAAGRYTEALDRFGQADRLGERCQPLLILACIKAGQRLLLVQHQDIQGIPVAKPVALFQTAADLMEKAVGEGCQDPNALSLLALAYKRQGKVLEARNTLLKIVPQDANGLLQLGLLALDDRQLGQAEQEFARAWQLDPSCYPAGYNLLLTRLSLGQLDAARNMVAEVGKQVPSEDDQQLIGLLRALLHRCQPTNGERSSDPALDNLSPALMKRLVKLMRSLCHLDTADLLLRTLLVADPTNAVVRAAHEEIVLVKSQRQLERCNWSEALHLLAPLLTEQATPRRSHAALLNLAGCCACLGQDFDRGAHLFTAALRLQSQDARLEQNLALAYELQQLPDRAAPHWNRYLELIDQRLPVPADQLNYVEDLAYECLYRLGNLHSDREQWSAALGFMQRAQKMRPDDPDLLEKIFHLYNHLDRAEEARLVLKKMVRLRPEEANYELYQLDLIRLDHLDDVEHLLDELDRILKKHSSNLRLEERATGVIGNAISFLVRQAEPLTQQLNKTVSRLRRLPDYEIDWREASDALDRLRSRFRMLRRIADQCMQRTINDGQRQTLRDLRRDIDRQIERCRSLR